MLLERAIVFCMILFFPILGAAQDAIRVQSNEVLVPTVVFDKVLYAQLNTANAHHRDSYGHLAGKNSELWENVAVKGLTEKDFHLFEDGVEQKIQRVKMEPPEFRVVVDNLGKHPEIVGSGGGLWAYPDLPKTDRSEWLGWPQYVLAYVPPKSATGSCHQIEVKVGRKNLTVWARSEYCNTMHPASDPLDGTEFGGKLEAAAKSGRTSDLDLKLSVASFTDNPSLARVYVSMDFPVQSLQYEFLDGTLYATIGSLVMVYRKNGTLAARYSDFACCDYGNEKTPAAAAQNAQKHEEQLPVGRALIPDRYETQFALAAGEYEVRAVLSDGIHFGVQMAALKVENYNASKLGISDVVVSRRVRKVPTNATEAAAQVADSYTALLSKGVEFTPAAGTQFWPEEMLFVYFEIYDPPGAAASMEAKVQVNMQTVNVKTGAVVDTFAPVDVTSYRKAGSAVIAMGRGVKLNRLPPGEYRLEVQANDASGRSTGWRGVQFTVAEAAPLELK